MTDARPYPTRSEIVQADAELRRLRNAAARPLAVRLHELADEVATRQAREQGAGRDGQASYWLQRAAGNLDNAVQCCGSDESTEIDAMESRCDELAAILQARGN